MKSKSYGKICHTDKITISALKKLAITRSAFWQNFATIYGGTGTVTFGYDDSVTAATTMFGLPMVTT
jgi:hypothetical protein